jgi:hypothetical protein
MARVLQLDLVSNKQVIMNWGGARQVSEDCGLYPGLLWAVWIGLCDCVRWVRWESSQ